MDRSVESTTHRSSDLRDATCLFDQFTIFPGNMAEKAIGCYKYDYNMSKSVHRDARSDHRANVGIAEP